MNRMLTLLFLLTAACSGIEAEYKACEADPGACEATTEDAISGGNGCSLAKDACYAGFGGCSVTCVSTQNARCGCQYNPECDCVKPATSADSDSTARGEVSTADRGE